METESVKTHDYFNLSVVPSMSPSIDKLADAMAKAQGVIKGAEKDSENPFFKSSYADLASNIEATRKPFSDNGLSVIQTVNSQSTGHFVTTLIMHSSGQWISSGAMQLPPVQNNDAQKTLAALTYFRRGQFAAMCRLAQIDDDGNSLQPQAPRPQSTTSNNTKPQNFAPQTRTQAQNQNQTRPQFIDPETQNRIDKLKGQNNV